MSRRNNTDSNTQKRVSGSGTGEFHSGLQLRRLFISKLLKGGPLGISNQESQQDLFLFHEEISKDKFFSTCDFVLFFLEGWGDIKLNRFSTLDTNPITPSSENFLSASCMLTSGSQYYTILSSHLENTHLASSFLFPYYNLNHYYTNLLCL